MRGDARAFVDPDFAVLTAAVTVSAAAKADALSQAGDRLRSLEVDLGRLGGMALRVDTTRAALTWSAQSTSTQEEHAHDERTGQWGPTGRVGAVVAVRLQVRALGLLDELGARLARHDGLDVQHVAWGVDENNPGWTHVRAAAVRAAVVRAGDYAAALGGVLGGIDHLADVGLMGTGDLDRSGWVANQNQRYASYTGQSGPAGPSLDPVPQELVAVVEARFTATGVSLQRP